MRINKLVDLCTLLRTQKQLDFGAKDLPINFCKKCFKEQLKTQGFTYFKQDWALHSQCSIHNCQLYTFLPETPKKAISSLKGILALNYDQTVSPFSRTKISKIQSDHPSYLFAPCAEPMASKLMWDLRIFPEGYTELPDYTNYSKGAFSILQRANYLEEIEPRWASEVLKSPPPFLNKFTEHLLSTLELIKDSAAVSDNAPPLEQCYKLKGKKCDKCTLPCPSSKKIESSLIDSPQEFKSVPSSQHCDSWAIDLLHTVNRRNEKTIRTSETQLWVEASRQKGSRVYKNVQEVRKRLFEELSNHKY
ncbi:hypothetical protein [Idiomarina sp. UBA4520]|uniref:hypothetical protein n=1 Tax=Idiomarina sp. UBA4520 TaxID=1946647 RepID=UPI000C4D8B31|nr:MULTISPECIES: hypothetical protein [unclassified Idiomarina]MBF38322.1 hypothetical protein [Idiomarinaceae bacterium]